MDCFRDQYLSGYRNNSRLWNPVLGLCICGVDAYDIRIFTSICRCTRFTFIYGWCRHINVRTVHDWSRITFIFQYLHSITQHHYSGTFCSGNGALLQDLMTKSTIRSNLSAYIPDIRASRANGLDYIFGETNSFSCHVTSVFTCGFKT